MPFPILLPSRSSFPILSFPIAPFQIPAFRIPLLPMAAALSGSCLPVLPFPNSPSRPVLLPVSGAGHEEFLVRLGFCRIGSGIGGDVLYEFAAALRAFALNYAHAARGHVTGFEAEDAAFADFNL
jgi:hypothetical protein